MSEQEIPLSSYVLAGRWRFQAQVGFGSDGTVYLARDEHTGERVAIKVYDSLVGREAQRIRAKIEEEANVSAGVDSPFLVRVIQWGLAPGQGGVDAGYMVMEYLEGETLREVLERRVAPMTPVEAMDMARLVLFAVNSLHRQGYVHCDLKPENVFVLAPHSDESRRIPVKIFDFGAARPIGSTQESVGRGTPIYCSPEVAQRAPGLGYQTDVYSLGVMLYELLTGRPPLDPAATPAQLVAQHVFGELDPLPEPLAASPIDAIYRRATEKDPEKRYRDAGAMLTAITALRPVRSARLPSHSPFSSQAVEDSVGGDIDRLEPSTEPAPKPATPPPPIPTPQTTARWPATPQALAAVEPHAPAQLDPREDEDEEELPILLPEVVPSERGSEFISQGSTIDQVYESEPPPLRTDSGHYAFGRPASSSTEAMVVPAIPKKPDA